eukprot:763056-Hanusia_phi.AAC.16
MLLGKAIAEGFWNFCSNRSNILDAVCQREIFHLHALRTRFQILAVMCIGALFAFVYMPTISETLEEDLALLMYFEELPRSCISLIEISRNQDEHEPYEHDTLLSSMMAEGNNRNGLKTRTVKPLWRYAWAGTNKWTKVPQPNTNKPSKLVAISEPPVSESWHGLGITRLNIRFRVRGDDPMPHDQ